MNKLKLSLSLLSLAATSSFATLQTPSSVQLKVYEFLVSTSPLCTNLVSIYNVASPSYTEMTTNATIASGSVANGTYPCLVMVFSDQIKYTATATSGTCTTGTEYTKDICRAGAFSTSHDGNVVTCFTSVDDKITVYITTASTGTGDSSQPPTAETGDPNGVPLTTPLVVSGTQSGTFVFDVTNGLDDTLSLCSLENVSFNFR